MKELHLQNFDDAVAKTPGIAIVDFWAAWCGPCRMIAPILEEIDRDEADVTVMKVNVDEEPALADRFGIEAIPTLLFFKDGTLFKKKTGLYPKDALDQILREIRA